MARVHIDLIADATRLLRAFRSSAEGAETLKVNLRELGVAARQSAETRVKASLHADSRMRAEIVAYRQVASAAAKGSREQIVASRLAGEAQLKLSRSMGVTVRESRRLSSSAGTLERDFSRLGRGAIYGTGAFHGLGRSMLYAGGSLLAGAGLIQGLKSTVSAATTSRAALGQLQTAVRDAGVSYSAYRGQIDEALKSQQNLGFSEAESARAFSTLIRGSHDVGKAIKEQGLAADIARGKNIPLGVAANAVARAYGGQTGALRRLVPSIHAGVSATEAIREATVAFGGASVKWSKSAAGEQARLSVAIERTKITIGTALLPTVTALSAKLADWLSQSKNQERIQRDVTQAVHAGATAVKVLREAFQIVAPVVKTVSGALGGLKHTLEITAAVMAAFKFTRMLDGIGGIGMKSRVAAGEVSLLRGRLLALRSLGVIGITIVAGFEASKELQRFDKWLGGKFGQSLGIGSYGDFNKVLAAKRAGKIPAPSGLGGPVGSAGGPTGLAGPMTARPSLLPGRVSGSVTTGAGNLSAMARADLALSAAGRTTSTADDLVALRTQRELLAKAIRTETGRLANAPTAALAKKFADNLQNLQDKDAAAFSQIQSIEDQAAAKASAARRKIEAAAAKAKREHARALRAAAVAHAKEVRATIAAGGRTEGQFAPSTSDLFTFSAPTLAGVDKQTAALRAHLTAGLPKALAAIGGDIQTANEQRLFKALGLGKSGQGQSPLKESLGKELARVKGALKGTLLDTSKNTGLLATIGKGLDGQFGVLDDKMKAGIRKLLDTLDKESKKGKSGFGPTGRVVTAEGLTRSIHFANVAARREQEVRIAQALAHGGRVPTAMGVQGQAVVVHHQTILDGRVLERSVTTHQQKTGRYRGTQTSGIHAGRGPV